MATITTSQELYCVIPAHLAPTLLEPLAEHLASYGIATIVERRGSGPTPYSITRQRAMHVPRSLPELPAHLAEHVSSLNFVQRMAPAGLTLADHDLMEVVREAGHGNGPAGSELIFRMAGRIHSRLQSRHHAAETSDMEQALGRMLDRIDGFTGTSSGEFYGWLDAVVDDR